MIILKLFSVPQTIMSFMNIAAAILVATCIKTPKTIPKKTNFMQTELQISNHGSKQ